MVTPGHHRHLPVTRRISLISLIGLIGLMLIGVRGIQADGRFPQDPPEQQLEGSGIREDQLVETVGSPETASLFQPALIDRFTPWLGEDDLAAGDERAWEYRPYRVAVWLCPDGSSSLTANLENFIRELNRRAELIDPSGWNLRIGEAPSQYRWKFLSLEDSSVLQQELNRVPLLDGYDKLMVVVLRDQQGNIPISVREYDLLTQQWGPPQLRTAAEPGNVPAVAMQAIRQAFMPITRIERVDVRADDTEIFLQVRARDSSLRVELTEDQQWQVLPIADSPVAIQDKERFLPVVRRFDRDGRLTGVDPMELTFLYKTGVSDTGEIKCGFVSSQRAPLAGRKTRMAERLALVIRPPDTPTWLYLHSMDSDKRPIPGIQVYSARPQDRDRTEAARRSPPEYLGKTDWEGKIQIPPSLDGIRVLTVGRGARGGLMRLPIIPGLFNQIASGIPDDETSLFAEGILQGFQQEILNQVIQREVFEREIIAFLDNEQLDKAKSKLREYESMESIRDIRARLNSEQTALENLKLDMRQVRFIRDQFSELSKILSNQEGATKVSEINARIQEMSGITGNFP
jgi:hypothetical protein